ncbi:hypothetical protein F5Y19DRAFT_491442 [Xylariaceae sp. FL1651]|nr:hypothetical protein F5Y19DRAFT_491442 [Xylariaceae sp. FL1651]
MHIVRLKMQLLELSFLLLPVLLSQASLASAQERPNTTTPCDFYTQKTIGNNTATNQQLLMTLVLHSALLGPYSEYNTVSVPDFIGALTPTMYDGQYVDLSVYFTGALKSSNTGTGQGEAVNWLDDGGLDAARQSKPGNGNITSSQYKFFTHVYSYFGTFLGCSHLGSPELPTYKGRSSMYEVHKYQYLNEAEMGFFVQQAVLGLKSFGFSAADAQGVNASLQSTFNLRCSQPAGAVPQTDLQLQAICTAPDCRLAPNNTCAAYESLRPAAVADQTLVGNFSKAADGTTSVNISASAIAPSPSSKPNAGVVVFLEYGTAVFSMLGTIVLSLL